MSKIRNSIRAASKQQSRYTQQKGVLQTYVFDCTCGIFCRILLHQSCSWKTAAPKIFNKIHNKYLSRSLFSSSNRKKTSPKIFSVDFGKLLGTNIFGTTPEWLFLKILYKDIFNDNYWPFKLPSHFKNRAPIECT